MKTMSFLILIDYYAISMKRLGVVMKVMDLTTSTMRLATKNTPAQLLKLFENMPLSTKLKIEFLISPLSSRQDK